MAKDGSNRGGKRINQTGRPRKSPLEKLENGNSSGRKLTVISNDINLEPVDIEGVDMPKPEAWLSEMQRDGTPFGAAEIFNNVYIWLRKVKCENLVRPELVNNYAVNQALWESCCKAIIKFGVIAKHPTTGAPIQSPYVAVSSTFMKHASYAWTEIYQIVRDNSTVDYRGPNPRDDMMEKILNSK